MIETSTITDYKKIVEIGGLLNKKFKELYPIESLYNDYTKIIVYKSKTKIIGFLHYEILIDTVNILNLVVEPSYRRKNIATMLLDYMLSDLCNKNIKTILLEVSSENYHALNLYTKFNFEVVNIRKKYYDGIDGFVMERRIKL